MKHKGKKILSLLLAVLMLVGLAVPTGLLAPAAKAEGEATETTDVTVTIEWDDADKPEGVTETRPASLTLTLNNVPSGVTVPDPVVAKDGNTWTYTWNDLPKYTGSEEAGYEEIEYTVSEDPVPRYYYIEPNSPVPSGGTILNTTHVIPANKKDRVDNGDGTYTISLTVTGNADVNEVVDSAANILIVYDTSTSMTNCRAPVETGSYGGIPVANSEWGQTNYYQLYHANAAGTGGDTRNPVVENEEISSDTVLYYRTSNNAQWQQYTQKYADGTYKRFSSDANSTRADFAEDALHDFCAALTLYQGVRIAIVGFDNSDALIQGWTDPATAATQFDDGIDGQYTNNRYHNNTRWDLGFSRALTLLQNIPADNTNDTYVLFVTDGIYTGNTTFATAKTYSNRVEHYDTIHETYDTSATNYKDNTTLFGVYAFGTNADWLDDVIYYSQTGSSRTNETEASDNTGIEDRYYRVESSAEFLDMINDIFQKIVQALGISTVSIADGTTSNVTTSSGEVANLLGVDESSYQYYLTIPMTANSDGTYKFTDNQKNEIKVAVNNGKANLSWTDSTGSAKTASYDIAEQNAAVFKLKWSAKTDFYAAAPAAKLNGSSVDWNLSSLGTLLNGVTYTVEFDVYPSQETYDLIADLKNGTKSYDDLDSEIKKYLHEDNGDYALDTNTGASLSYSDTRYPDSDPRTTTMTTTDAVGTDVSEMTVTKVWYNDLDWRGEDQYAAGFTMDLTRDGDKCDTVTVKADDNWTDSVYIATGLMRVKKNAAGAITGIQVMDTGHDYTVVEPEGMTYHWELVKETIHPMLINGTLTSLVQVLPADIPDDMGTADFYTLEDVNFYRIGKNVYKENGQGSQASVSAYNERKSNINLTKVVTGDAPKDAKFVYTLTVTDNNGDDVWFSVIDADKKQVYDITTSAEPEVSLLGYTYDEEADTYRRNESIQHIEYDQEAGTISYDSISTNSETGAETTTHYDVPWVSTVTIDVGGTQTEAYRYKTGYYFEKSATAITVTLQAGWNLRFTNIPTNSTYVIEESSSMVPGFTFDSVNGDTPIKVSELPDGAVDLGVNDAGEHEYIYDGITYIKDGNSFTATYQPTINGAKVEGKVVSANASYQTTYTNKYPRTTLTVEKVWEGTPPENGSVEVTLYQDGEETQKTITLNADKDWTDAFADLDIVNATDRSIIQYSAKETPITGYTTSYEGTTDVVVNVTGAAAETEITVSIGDKTATATTDADGTATVTVEGVPFVDEAGDLKELEATVSADGATATIAELTNRTITITNTESTSVQVEKTFSGITSDQIPAGFAITVSFTANGTTIPDQTLKITGGDITPTASNNNLTYTWTIDGLPNGTTVSATETGTGVTNYTLGTVTNSGTVTTAIGDTPKISIGNPYTQDKGTLTITKTITGLPEGAAPSGLKFTITGPEDYSNEVAYSEFTNGSYSIANLPVGEYSVVESGTDYTNYTLDTASSSDASQTGSVTKDGIATVTFTNVYTRDTGTLTIKKVAQGLGDNDSIPTGTTFTIRGPADYTGVTSITFASFSDDGSWSLTGVPTGEYTITETTTTAEVTGYTLTNTTYSSTDGKVNVTTTAAGEVTVTNVYTPDTATLKITKTTSGGAATPDTAKFVITGTPTAAGQTFTETTVTYAQIKDGSYSLTVPVGNYIVTEDEKSAEVAGYTLVISGDNGGNGKPLGKNEPVTFTITNAYTDDTATLKITKTAEGTTVPDDAKFVITGTPTAKDLTFSAVTVTYAEIKNGTFEKEVPVGTYKVTEDKESAEVPGYTLTVGGDNDTNQDLEKGDEITFAISNTYKKDTAKLKITKTTTGGVDTPDTAEFVISGTPTAADQRFADVTVTYADIKGGSYELEVPVGKYTVTETEKTATVTGYGLTVTGDNGKTQELTKGGEISFAITNTYESGKTNVEVKKVWNDNEDQDRVRPTEITVNLLADGQTADSVTLSEKNNWTYSFSVPEYAGGQKIIYTVEEAPVKDYNAPEISGDAATGFTITNTHDADTTEVTVTKKWDDGNNQDGKRPDSITVNLLADGNKVESKDVTAADGWTCTFIRLPVNKNGNRITYTISEEEVPGYTADISGDATKGFTITNKYDPLKQDVTVEKLWDDGDNQDGKRPDSITVYLFVNGEKCGEKTLSESNGWKDTWEGLPKMSGGKDLTYTVEEDVSKLGNLYVALKPVKTASGYTITNKHEPEVLKPFTVTKVWNDDNNKAGKRPSSVTVTLLANGKPAVTADGKTAATATLTEANGWTYTFENLPKYEKGNEITYTLKETAVGGYENGVVAGDTTNGFTVTNTVKDDTPPSPPPFIRIEIVKVWEDDSNAAGIRTETVEVALLKGDMTNFTKTLGDTNEWKYECLVEAGYNYKVVETPVEGYDSIVTQTSIPGGIRFTVTNKLTKTPDLNTKDHVAYIVGYPDGTVRPAKEITRAEVATIFFRLLTDEARDLYWSQANPYPDVKLDDWFNNAISTLTNMGIINGYEDGTFRPNNPITRAELTKMAVSFFSSADQYFGKTPSFSDVPADAWYTRFIAAAEALGLINGYPDGTFRPTNYITRAETCTIVNRTLGRGPHKDHLLPYAEMINWPDNTPDAWYYAQIQEASNSHDYDWITEQIENTTVEQWLAKLPERDWVALEQIWSNSHSAPGGEVMG